ncbi:MAG: hypothetical protein OEW39_11185 [Deltaproteobacteria bacterium]|nr:hypothetical protein [Deltaproteobacteria bacterium]
MNQKKTGNGHGITGRTGWRLGLLLGVALLALSGCMAEEVAENKSEPTWVYIQPAIFAGRGGCTNCHSAAADPLDCKTFACGLSWTADQWARITGSGGTGTLLASGHAGNPKPIITPGDITQSFLLDKIEGTQGSYGKQMPLGASPLSDPDIQLIKDWIEDGAPEK